MISRRVPPCAERLLARPEWFTDPGVVSRAKLTPAKWYARILSSEFFAKTIISAITLGRTIHIRLEDQYDPHTELGLYSLAHEIKHVEQYERDGFFKFFAKYVWAYLFHGYGDEIPSETEAYGFEKIVRDHIRKEFRQNQNIPICLDDGEPHQPNLAFRLIPPE